MTRHVIDRSGGTECNWFWGSHGCDLPSGHDGNHQCGEDDELCCEHDGTRSRFPTLRSRRQWGDWSPVQGFCLDENHGPCGDPANCQYRDNPGHQWVARKGSK